MSDVEQKSQPPALSSSRSLIHALSTREWFGVLLIWALLTSTFFFRFLTFRLALFDTAVTAHVYWRLANGLSDLTSLTGVHHLGDHLSLTGLALTPAFVLGTRFGMLVYAVLQAASATGVVVAVLIAARRSGLSLVAQRVTAGLTLLAPGAYLITNFGLREFALGIGPLALTVSLLRYGDEDDVPVVWAIIAAVTRLEFAVSILLIGLVSRSRRGSRTISLIGGVATIGFVGWMVMSPFPGASAGAHFSHLGSSLSEIAASVIERPLDVLRPAGDMRWLAAMVGWLLPFGLIVPLLRPSLLVPALPFVAIPVLGTWALADAYPEHYWHPLLVFAPLAMVEVLRAVPGRIQRVVLMVASTGTVVAWMLFFPWSAWWLGPWGGPPPEVASAIESVEATDSSLAATAPAVHYLLDRAEVYALPDPFECRSIGGAIRSDREAPRLLIAPRDTLDSIRVDGIVAGNLYERTSVQGDLAIFRLMQISPLPSCK